MDDRRIETLRPAKLILGNAENAFGCTRELSGHRLGSQEQDERCGVLVGLLISFPIQWNG